MEDNYVIERIISILNNEKQSLIVGNISNPKPGICNVNTDYGIKSAININATYPGEVLVVWDREKEQYYCFTTKPSNVINNRQISYRKYKDIENKSKKERYVWYGSTMLYGTGEIPSTAVFNREDRVEPTSIFVYKVLKKLNPNIKDLYVSKPDSEGKFFGMPANDNITFRLEDYPDTYYDAGLRYLQSKGINIILVEDTELNKVKGTLWVQQFAYSANPSFLPKHIKAIKKIAKSYGVLFEEGASSYDENEADGGGEFSLYINPMISLLLDTFYNPYIKPSLTETISDQIRTYMYSNFSNYLDVQINGGQTLLFDMNLIIKQNIFAYSYKVNYYTKQITSDTKYASVFYWEV